MAAAYSTVPGRGPLLAPGSVLAIEPMLTLGTVKGLREGTLLVCKGRFRPEFLDGLKERSAHATFFLIGEQIAEKEGFAKQDADRIKRIFAAIAKYGDKSLPLAQVPPVLLSEAYADYLAVAQACSGYDAGWEKKMPW